MCTNLLFHWHCFPIRHRCATRKKERKKGLFIYKDDTIVGYVALRQSKSPTQAPLSGQGEEVKTFVVRNTNIYRQENCRLFCYVWVYLPHRPTLWPRRTRRTTIRNCLCPTLLLSSMTSIKHSPNQPLIQRISTYATIYSFTHFADCSTEW